MRKSLSRRLVLSGLLAIGTAALVPPAQVRAQFLPRRTAATRAATSSVNAVPEQIVVKVPAAYAQADVNSLAASVGATVLYAIPYSPTYYVFTLSNLGSIGTTTPDASAQTKAVALGKGRLTRAAAPVASDVAAAVATLIKTPGVMARPNYLRYKFQTSGSGTGTSISTTTATGPALGVVPNDPLYFNASYPTDYPSSMTSVQWDMEQINMPQAWAIQSNSLGRTVVVAVVDSGLDTGHPDLTNQIAAAGGIDVTPIDLGGTPTTVLTDPDGHGTNVSGIADAQTNNGIGVSGVAGWNRSGVSVKVLPVRILDDTGAGTIAGEIAGINYATGQNVDVMNFSFGGGPYLASDLTTDPEYAAILAATNAGITIVAAAGNDAFETGAATGGYFYPADFPNVIAVSATNRQRTLSSFSNFGFNLAIAAPGGDPGTFLNTDPGEQILNTYSRFADTSELLGAYPISPNIGYTAIAGTSQACPHVSGAAALLIAAGATRNYTNIKALLQNGAQTLDEVPNFAGGNKYGAGLLDVYKSLTLVPTLTPGFTAQIADVVDNSITAVTTSISTYPAAGSSGYSLVASEPYTDRGITYVRPQPAFTIRYAGRNALIDSSGVDHPQYVTLDIAPATQPTSVLRHFVGGTSNTTTTFALPALPSGSNPASVLTVAVPGTGSLSLPDGNYRATLSVFNTTTSTYVPQGTVFFATASHTQPSGLTMFSSPFTVNSSVVGTLPAELFEFGTSANFTLERYITQRLPTDNEYAVFSPNPNAVQDTRAEFTTPRALDGSPISYLIGNTTTSSAPVGLGYWLSLDSDTVLNPTGDIVSSAVAVKLFAANGGWNMIGDPFTYSIAWPSVSVLAANGQTYSLQGAADAGIISPAIISYVGGQYVYAIAPAGTLDPFMGYWARAFQDCTLIMAPGNSTRSAHFSATPVTSRAMNTAPRTSQLPTVNGWRARLAATVAGDHDGENYFGILRSTTLSERYYDLAKPPSGGGHAYLRFAKPDLSGKAEIYAMDMRKNGGAAPQETWNADFSTDKTDAPVTLSWDGLGGVPHGSALYLTDVSTGKKVSMHQRSSYSFKSGVAGSTRRFQISLEHELSSGELAISNFHVVNGAGGRAQGHTTREFRFTANREATATAVIRALNGREIMTLGGTGTRAESAQESSLIWNGRKADGSALPIGMYVVELTITTADGQKATVKQSFMSLN